MDGAHFDELARSLSHPRSRRFALGGIVAGLLLPLDAIARGKGKKHKDKRRSRAQAQQVPCWRAGACIPKKGANVSRCDLEGYSPTTTLDCTGCNASRANLRGAQLQGASFTRANLSGACLVDADFTGATFANTTNLANAVFCRTTMPDGSVNDSGCDSGTACCGNCSPACAANQFCCDGTCSNCPCGQGQLSNGTCVTACTSSAQCCGSCRRWQTNANISFCSTGVDVSSCGVLGDNACLTGQFCTQTGFCTPACSAPG